MRVVLEAALCPGCELSAVNVLDEELRARRFRPVQLGKVEVPTEPPPVRPPR